jgi:beta-lactamase superfamily II metal-dependent hydrolase
MCPNNKLGKIDLYVVSHHGFEQSGSPGLVDAIAPALR